MEGEVWRNGVNVEAENVVSAQSNEEGKRVEASAKGVSMSSGKSQDATRGDERGRRSAASREEETVGSAMGRGSRSSM